MHKLMEYVCSELEELERKVDKDGKLSMAETQYGDTLAHMKKNLLKADEMWEDGEYSMAMGGDMPYTGRGGRGGRSYARGGRRRDSMGRYSSAGYSYDYKMDLEELMRDAPNERVKAKLRDIMQDM